MHVGCCYKNGAFRWQNVHVRSMLPHLTSYGARVLHLQLYSKGYAGSSLSIVMLLTWLAYLNNQSCVWPPAEEKRKKKKKRSARCTSTLPRLWSWSLPALPDTWFKLAHYTASRNIPTFSPRFPRKLLESVFRKPWHDSINTERASNLVNLFLFHVIIW